MNALYRGTVMHRRVRPVPHALRYRVFPLLLDIDRLADTARAMRLMSYNRFNLFSFHDRDHGERDGSSLRPWVEDRLREAGLSSAAHKVLLLSFPRVLGYVFNPLSVYFCFDAQGELGAVLYEVKNTFGEQHAYVLPGGSQPVTQTCSKGFHVSPFLPVEGGYRFRFRLDDRHAHVDVNYHDAQGLMLATSVGGRREPLTDAHVVRRFLLNPVMTIGVVVRIHWQALHLFCKRARFHSKPEPPNQLVTR